MSNGDQDYYDDEPEGDEPEAVPFRGVQVCILCKDTHGTAEDCGAKTKRRCIGCGAMADPSCEACKGAASVASLFRDKAQSRWQVQAAQAERDALIRRLEDTAGPKARLEADVARLKAEKGAMRLRLRMRMGLLRKKVAGGGDREIWFCAVAGDWKTGTLWLKANGGWSTEADDAVVVAETEGGDYELAKAIAFGAMLKASDWWEAVPLPPEEPGARHVPEDGVFLEFDSLAKPLEGLGGWLSYTKGQIGERVTGTQTFYSEQQEDFVEVVTSTEKMAALVQEDGHVFLLKLFRDAGVVVFGTDPLDAKRRLSAMAAGFLAWRGLTPKPGGDQWTADVVDGEATSKILKTED